MNVWLGVAFGLSASVGFAASAVFARLGLQYMRVTTGTLASLVVGAVITMVLALLIHSEQIFALSAVAFAWFLLVGFVNFPLGRLLNYTGVSLVGVSKATPIVGTNPLFATVLAISFGGETVNLPIVLGTFCIIGGLSLILSQR